MQVQEVAPPLNLSPIPLESYIEPPRDLVEMDGCINRLVYGTHVQMIKKSKKKAAIYSFFINPISWTELNWINHSKQNLHKIDLANITSISNFAGVPNTKGILIYDSSAMLKVSYGRDEKLILMFKDQTIKEQFRHGLQFFVDKIQKEDDAKLKDVQAFFSREVFFKSDRDGNGTLDKKEVKSLMKSLNMKPDFMNIDELIDEYDTDNNGKLDYQEFTEFLNHLLRKNEVFPVFQKYASQYSETKNEPIMTPKDLINFYEIEQKQVLTLEEIYELNDKFINVQLDAPVVTFEDFSIILFSPMNRILDPEVYERCEDLTRPLTDYYINSSHNTYLMNNQLTGVSSAQAYITALKRGCRCVELDLWDGPHSEPIIYHGHTMTSKITCQGVIRILKEHAFTVNPYPLILSFEMHCGLKAQKRIAQILQEEIGDMIFSVPQDRDSYTYYPSPDSLQKKFIIKSKGKLSISSILDRKKDECENIHCEEAEDRDQKLHNMNNLEREIPNKSMIGVRNDTEERQVISPKQYNTNLSSPEVSSFPIHHHLHLPTRLHAHLPFHRHSHHSSQLDSNLIASLSHHIPPEVALHNNQDPQYQRSSNKSSTVVTPCMNVQTEEKTYVRQNTDFVRTLDSPSFYGEAFSDNTILPMSFVDKRYSVIAENNELYDKVSGKKMDKIKIKVDDGLNILYGMIGRKLDLSKLPSIWEICSLKEEKMDVLYKTKLPDMVEYHKSYFTRIYPSNFRFRSTNYNPMPAWGMGSQLVALNFQHHDESMLLNYAKFQRNGGSKCGYVLKPSFMLHDSPRSNYAEKLHQLRVPVKRVTIQVISAQALKPYDPNSKRRSNPYVEVRMRGLDHDEKQNITFKTHTVHHNSFHPIWSVHERSSNFTFSIAVPELATFIFTVYCEDHFKKHKLGRYAVELKNMRQGFRVIPLLNHELRRIKNSYLLCYISIYDA